MKNLTKNSRGARHLASLIFIALALCLLLPTPTQAQNVGLSMSGNFDSQHFILLCGETLEDADIYVIVGNPGDSPISVKMSAPDPPLQVELLLPEWEFDLQPGKNRQLNVSINVGQAAVPGDYSIALIATTYRPGAGILVGAGGQAQAKLTILGEAGTVVITAVGPEGESFPANVGVYKETNGTLSLVYPLQRSRLETKLAPGDYIAQAHYEGTKVTEEKFNLSVDEQKEIVLVCYSPCLVDFSLSPVHSAEGVLTSARIGYSIANLLQPVDDFSAMLKVSLNGKFLEEAELVSLPMLAVGFATSGNYSYSPSLGWQKGSTYSFVIEFYILDELYYQSPPKELTTEGRLAGINWAIICGIIVVIVAAGAWYYFVKRRKPKKT